MKIFYVLLALFVLCSFSCGTTNTNTGSTREAMPGETFTILGTITIFGSEPRTDVGIVDRSGVAYLVQPRSVADEFRGRAMQGRLIEFRVTLLDQTPPAGFRGVVTPIEWNVIPLQ